MAAHSKQSEIQQAILLMLSNTAALASEMREHAKDMAEFRKQMLSVHATLDEIKAILARHEVILHRHETILAQLPEAIQQRIGFARP